MRRTDFPHEPIPSRLESEFRGTKFCSERKLGLQISLIKTKSIH